MTTLAGSIMSLGIDRAGTGFIALIVFVLGFGIIGAGNSERDAAGGSVGGGCVVMLVGLGVMAGAVYLWCHLDALR